jgi:hypothetical protein
MMTINRPIDWMTKSSFYLIGGIYAVDALVEMLAADRMPRA